MALELHLLGAPRLEQDGEPVGSDTRKALAMLAYLVVTGEYHTRDALAALLWPEMDEDRARAALRRTLSSLKTAVGESTLYITREGVGLDPDADLWSDIVAFEQSLARAARHTHTPGALCASCVADLEAAVELYHDDFMAGFSLRDSAEFDTWQSVQTEGYRRQLSTALGDMVQFYSRQGEWARAIEHNRRWLAVDPLREEAHRWLMKLHAWKGDRDLALRHYRDVVRLFDEELGVQPLPETTAVYEAIQEGALALPAPVSVGAGTGPPAFEPAASTLDSALGAPLGREAAWADLVACYEAIGATGRLAAIAGETGIGKTRLAEAFLAYGRYLGATTVQASFYEGEAHLAYAPFAAALRALLAQPPAAARLADIPEHWLSEVTRLVPELQPTLNLPPPRWEPNSPGAQARFFAAVSEVLCHLLAGASPGILFLDDAHWADAASLDLLAYLTRRLADLPVLILVAWTDDQLSGEHRLRRLQAEAQRRGAAQLVELERWRPEDVAALVAAAGYEGDEAEAISARLYRETEGLPYFVVEYLAALPNAGDIWAMPQSVRDLLAARVAAVEQTGLQLLQTAAVIGRSFNYDIVWTASGRSEDEVVDGLETLLAHGLIREDAMRSPGEASADVRYDFAHQQLRSLVYDETNLARRRLLHRRVATAMQSPARGSAGEAATSLIGYHFRLGGSESEAAVYYRRAADHARSLYANREALGHYQTALALGHPATAELHEAGGDMHLLLGEYTAALHAYESAAALLAGRPLGRVEQKIGRVYERRGDFELADSHFCAALEHGQQAAQADDRVALLTDRSRAAYRLGRLDGAAELAEEALALAVDAGDPAAEAQVRNTLGILAHNRGELDIAREHLTRSLQLAETTGSITARVAALNNLARLAAAGDRINDALTYLTQALALCQQQGDRHHEAALYNNRADLLHAVGREEEAMQSLKQAVTIYAEIGLESGDWQPEIWKLEEW